MKPEHPLISSRNFALGLAFLAILFVQSCVNDNLSPKTNLLTVEIDPAYFDPQFDVWLFVSDRDGKTIDVRHAKDSTHVRFMGNPSATITFSIFVQVLFPSPGGGSSWNSFGLRSYQQIPAGSVIQLKNLAVILPASPDTLGSARISLMDFNDSSDPISSVTFSDGIANQFAVMDLPASKYTGSTLSTKLFIRQNPSRILATTYHNNAPVYLWLNDVKPTDNINFSFNDFMPSKTIPINKQINFGEVKTMTGANFATSYSFSNLYSWQVSKSSDLSKPPVLGYLDGFDKYFTSVTQKPFDAPDNVYYTKAGTAPQSITLPDYKFTLNKTDLYGLSIGFGNQYSYKQAYFIKSSSTMQINWTLYASDTEDFKAPSVPSQILSAYPSLTVGGLTMETASYTYCLDGYSYLDYAAANMANISRDVYEELRYVVNVK